MWTPQNRKRHDRGRIGVDYAVDPPAKPVGNERTIDLREVINGITYILGTGCQWQALANLPAFIGCTIISICGVMTARSMAIFLPAPWLLNGNENRGIANWCSPAPLLPESLAGAGD